MDVEFYFDYSSPFAYLGATQIERVARGTGGTVAWRPFLLGALFREIGTPLVPLEAMPAAKRAYVRRDMERWAAHWGVPFRFTPRFPLRTVRALRLTLLAPPASVPALVLRVMRACWVDGDDPEDRDVLTACARDAGIDVATLDRTDEPEVKEALRAVTAQAVARGVPGAPSFVVGDELFWGQDRLDFVARALERARTLG